MDESERERMRAKLMRSAGMLQTLMERRAPDVIVANELRLIARFGAIYLGKQPPKDPE